MERTGQLDLQHLGLATVCAVIYSKITGEIPNPSEPREMQAILDDVAHALSNIVVIFSDDAESGMPKPLAPLDLIEGQFMRGAQVFRTKRGEELRGLTMQRRDMRSALDILQSARIRFHRPGER